MQLNADRNQRWSDVFRHLWERKCVFTADCYWLTVIWRLYNKRDSEFTAIIATRNRCWRYSLRWNPGRSGTKVRCIVRNSWNHKPRKSFINTGNITFFIWVSEYHTQNRQVSRIVDSQYSIIDSRLSRVITIPNASSYFDSAGLTKLSRGRRSYCCIGSALYLFLVNYVFCLYLTYLNSEGVHSMFL